MAVLEFFIELGEALLIVFGTYVAGRIVHKLFVEEE